jgi:hypothetical protein
MRKVSGTNQSVRLASDFVDDAEGAMAWHLSVDEGKMKMAIILPIRPMTSYLSGSAMAQRMVVMRCS